MQTFLKLEGLGISEEEHLDLLSRCGNTYDSEAKILEELRVRFEKIGEKELSGDPLTLADFVIWGNGDAANIPNATREAIETAGGIVRLEAYGNAFAVITADDRCFSWGQDCQTWRGVGKLSLIHI